MQKMCKAAIVIHVQVSEDNPFHIARSHAEHPQLRPDLFFTIDSELDLPSDIRMERSSGFQQMSSLAGVNHNDALPVLDHPGISW